MIPVTVHISKNSPKRPNAKFSIYLQRRKIGISFKVFGVLGVLTRNRASDRIIWVRMLSRTVVREREEQNREEWEGSEPR